MLRCVGVFLRALKLLIPVTSIEEVKESGMSPLHSAAAGGHAQCLKVCDCFSYIVGSIRGDFTHGAVIVKF